MQLKNNQQCNVQLFYPVKKNGRQEVDYIHIPGGATVEIEDDVFAKLTAPVTEVTIWDKEVVQVEDDSMGKLDNKRVSITEFYDSGKTRKINLLLERIRLGEFTIVERAKVSEKSIDEVLAANGIDFSKMDAEAKANLYNKLV